MLQGDNTKTWFADLDSGRLWSSSRIFAGLHRQGLWFGMRPGWLGTRPGSSVNMSSAVQSLDWSIAFLLPFFSPSNVAEWGLDDVGLQVNSFFTGRYSMVKNASLELAKGTPLRGLRTPPWSYAVTVFTGVHGKALLCAPWGCWWSQRIHPRSFSMVLIVVSALPFWSCWWQFVPRSRRHRTGSFSKLSVELSILYARRLGWKREKHVA